MTMDGRDGEPRALTVAHRGGDRFRIRVRGHEIDVDQPVGDGGEDTAPTPTELFVAGLASCVAFYARRYLARHGLPRRRARSHGGVRDRQPARARRRGLDRGDASSRAAAAAAGCAARRRLALHRPQHTDHSSGRRHPARRRGVGTPPRGCHAEDRRRALGGQVEAVGGSRRTPPPASGSRRPSRRTPCAGRCRAPAWSARGSPAAAPPAPPGCRPRGRPARRRRRRRCPASAGRDAIRL